MWRRLSLSLSYRPSKGRGEGRGCTAPPHATTIGSTSGLFVAPRFAVLPFVCFPYTHEYFFLFFIENFTHGKLYTSYPQLTQRALSLSPIFFPSPHSTPISTNSIFILPLDMAFYRDLFVLNSNDSISTQ